MAIDLLLTKWDFPDACTKLLSECVIAKFEKQSLQTIDVRCGHYSLVLLHFEITVRTLFPYQKWSEHDELR